MDNSHLRGKIMLPRENMRFYFFLVFTQLFIHGVCWVSEKCFIYEGYVDVGISGSCPKSNLSGYCHDVSNVELDLAGIPSHLEVLCLELTGGTKLCPYSFSRFQKLRILKISKVGSTIFPGAFKNLSNLQTLQIDCIYRSNFSLSSDVLSDLQNITTISFGDCRLSSMAIDVFKGMNKMETIYLHTDIDHFSDLLCRLVSVSSLKYLFVYVIHLTILSQPNCTFSNGTSFGVEVFHGIEWVTLLIAKVNVIDKKVLKYFPQFLCLNIDYREFILLKSEIKKVDHLILDHYHQKIGGFDKICAFASELLVTSLTVTFSDITDNFTMNLEKCVTVKIFQIETFSQQTKLINLTFINMLRNLTSLYVVWRVKPESIERETVLALCENQSDLVTKIKIITLHTNSFKNLSYKHFSCLKDLEELHWVNSDIEYIEDFTFNNTGLLKYLDFSNNKISTLTEYSFFGLPNLKTLLLNANKLVVVAALTFMHLTSLESLSLGVFQYPSSEPSEIQINFSVPENLTNLNISSGRRPMYLFLGSSGKTKTNFNLHVCGQSVTFKDCENPLFKSLVRLTAETDQLLCGQTFPGIYLKTLKHLKIKPKHKTGQMDLTSLNQLVQLQSLTLFNIDLNLQPNLDVIFHNLSSLEYLALSLSWINSLEKDFSQELQSLKVLVLSIDCVFSMMESFVKPLRNLKYLIMIEPLLQCSCDNAWFPEWTKYQKNIQVYLDVFSLESLPCKTEEGNKLLSTYAQDNCVMDVDFLLFASTSLGLVFFMLVVLLHQLAGEYLLAFVHIARGWVEGAMRANKRGHYQFDVFVSYCGKDERWVVDELLPNLENRGPPFLRLCLHSRDFQLGKDIVENITDSLYRSRYTLCLISRNYLRSNWCSLEMRLATYRLQVEHKDILILVFLEKIPHHLLNAHHRLARLVKTWTYIDWPQDPALHNAFWDRLWVKLAPETAT